MGYAFGLKLNKDGIPDKMKLKKYALWRNALQSSHSLSPK